MHIKIRRFLASGLAKVSNLGLPLSVVYINTRRTLASCKANHFSFIAIQKKVKQR